MGAAASISVPEKIDVETFKTLCGDRFNMAIFDEYKEDDGYILKERLPELEQLTDCFLSHDWGEDEQGRKTHDRVARVNESLKSRGIITWFDAEKMEGNIVQQMSNGIDNTQCVLVFVTRNYMNKVAGTNANDNCQLEFQYGLRKKSAALMLPIVMEERMKNSNKWKGPVGFALGGLLYSNLISDDEWETKMDTLAAAIKKKTRWSDSASALKARDAGIHPPAPVTVSEKAAPPRVAEPESVPITDIVKPESLKESVVISPRAAEPDSDAPTSNADNSSHIVKSERIEEKEVVRSEPESDPTDSAAPVTDIVKPESVGEREVIRFNVGDNQVLGFLAGVYVDRGLVHDGYPVYERQEETDLDIVIAYGAAYKQWTIKPQSELNQASGWSYIQPTNAPCALLDAEGQWWAPSNGVYAPYSSVNVTRYTPEVKPRILSFSGFVEPCDFLNGNYTRTDETFNGFPIYKQDGIIVELTSGLWFFKPVAQKHVYSGWALCRMGKDLSECSGIWECANSDFRTFSEHPIKVTVVA